jgi:energy-coupling factor transporter ATP-binding protein EcfA2
LKEVGLGERLQHKPGELSGGEQQRVAVARALMQRPDLVLADEPTGNLDAQNEEIVLRLLRDLHAAGRTIVMVTHDPTVATLADRRVDLHHGRIAAQQVFAMADEEQVDEALEEIWIVMENGEPAELGRIEVDGAVPTRLLIERMAETGLVALQQHPPQAHAHKDVLNRCHDAIRPHGELPADGDYIVELTARGKQRAADIIRRHRLAERLFTGTLQMQNESEIEQQACKFEHILSPEATERICTFLGHPKTCPHGSPIPAGACCERKAASADD